MHLNTDAVDNSAGVDCSDHEVNIKIMLDRLVARGELDQDERNARLRTMTDDVARLVLVDNDGQNRTLSVESADAADLLPAHRRFLEVLEGAGAIDRALEALPAAAELDRRVRDGDGLTNPELCVLLAHAKISLRSTLLASDLPDEPWVRPTLQAYFPVELGEGLADRLVEHPLRREIVATVLVNDVVAAGGLTFAFRAAEETGSDAADVVRAFAVTRERVRARRADGRGRGARRAGADVRPGAPAARAAAAARPGRALVPAGAAGGRRRHPRARALRTDAAGAGPSRAGAAAGVGPRLPAAAGRRPGRAGAARAGGAAHAELLDYALLDVTEVAVATGRARRAGGRHWFAVSTATASTVCSPPSRR